MVGSSMVDLIARVPKMPAAGETLVGISFQLGFGGKGSNQAVMAARLGAQVSVVVRLGRDVFGENTLQNYHDHGIDTTHVSFDETRFSGVAPITVDDASGQNAIIVVPGANDSLSPEHVQEASSIITSADVLVCQLETPLASTVEAFRIAKEGRTLTMLNPAPAAALPDLLLQLTDVLVPNEIEAGMLVGRPVASLEDARQAARMLRAKGPNTVIITLGARGAVFLGDEAEVVHVPVTEVKAVDTTGAGYAFAGSLAYLLAKQVGLREAVRLACDIASRSVLSTGTQTSFPTREQLGDLMLP